MPIVSIIASWQRIMRIMESVLIEMTGTIMLTKHPQQNFNKSTFTNLLAILKGWRDLSKGKPWEPTLMWQSTCFYDKEQLYLLRVFFFKLVLVMDLVLLYDIDICHYVLNTDLVKVVCKVWDLKFKFDYRICRNCFWLCRDGLENYNFQTKNCYLNAPAVIQMPSPDKNESKISIF